MTLLAIVLTGIAVGALRAAPGQVIAQIGLTCAALLALIEISSTRLVNYWLALVVAVTIVLPLLARSQASATQGSGTGSRRVAWAGAMLLNVALNLSALAAFCIINNVMNVNYFIAPSPWTLPDAGDAIVIPAPVPVYGPCSRFVPDTPYLEAMPVLEPDPGPSRVAARRARRSRSRRSRGRHRLARNPPSTTKTSKRSLHEP